MSLTIGQAIPTFSLPATGDITITPSDFKGRWTVVYFYPRDNTPGCTSESMDFARAHADFTAIGANILGVSRDSMSSHERFKEKFSLPFELVSDTDEILCSIFGVIKPKNMYGKQVRGIERSTFLFNPDAKLVYEWRKVKVPGHVASVLEKLKELMKKN